MFNVSDSPSITWRPRLKIWKNNSGNARFDQTECRATSYEHWCFVRKIKGKVVFNSYYYSQQTRSHQSGMRAVLKQLKIKIDLELSSPYSLDRLDDAAESIVDAIETLRIETERVNSKAARNKQRQTEITALMLRLKQLKALGAKVSKETVKAARSEAIASEQRRLVDVKQNSQTQRLIRQEQEQLLNNSFINGV